MVCTGRSPDHPVWARTHRAKTYGTTFVYYDRWLVLGNYLYLDFMNTHGYFTDAHLWEIVRTYHMPHSLGKQYRIISLFNRTEWSCQLSFQATSLTKISLPEWLLSPIFSWHFRIFCIIFSHVKCWSWIYHQHLDPLISFSSPKVFVH